MTSRLERVRAILSQHNLDALMIQKNENRAYVSEFFGSAGIAVVTSKEAILLVDFRYVQQAGRQAPEFEVIKADRQFIEAFTSVAQQREWKRIGFESDAVTVKQHQEYTAKLQPAELVPVDGLDRLRWVKDEDELARIRKAVEIADAAFAHIRGHLRPGAVERDIAIEMEFFMRRQGADKEAFETIVASGPRSSLPHGRAEDRALAVGDFVTLDFGAIYRHYISDCTRTVVIGEVSAKQRDIYGTVLEAQETALRGIRAGMTGKAADALGREVIARAGYGDAFGHSLGHGVGLMVHEGPTLSPREEATLGPGMVVTVEPGIYLDGWGGVRIEDLVVIREQGCEILTRSPKELMVL